MLGVKGAGRTTRDFCSGVARQSGATMSGLVGKTTKE